MNTESFESPFGRFTAEVEPVQPARWVTTPWRMYAAGSRGEWRCVVRLEALASVPANVAYAPTEEAAAEQLATVVGLIRGGDAIRWTRRYRLLRGRR